MEAALPLIIDLVVTPQGLATFSTLLQAGVLLKAKSGIGVKEFLLHNLGLTPEYVDATISTIFLDGKPVDDIESAVLKEMSVLALSGAMPGLAGATMRRGGYYASLRSAISYRREAEQAPAHESFVVLKLFNVVAKDLGTQLLERGVWVNPEMMEGFLKDRPPTFWASLREARINGVPLEQEALRLMKWPESREPVYVGLSVDDGPGPGER